MTRPRFDRRGRRLRSVAPSREPHEGRRGNDSHRTPELKTPRYVPPPPEARPEELRPTDRVFQGLRLYPFQVRAVDAIASDHSVLVAAPTGSGKTLIADYAIEQAFAAGKRVVYTSPIKALSNQKFRDFRAAHGDDVGIMTGDVTMNPDAPLLVMTTEVFRNTLFDEPERLAQFGFVVHDEVHYLDDPERGTVWEESIIHAPSTLRLVCLSATVPNVRELADWIASVRGEEVTVVEMSHRPVPLDHMVWRPDIGPLTLDQFAKTPLLRGGRGRHRPRRDRSPAPLLDWLERERLLPVLYFCFSRKDCEAHALENRRRGLLPPPDRERMRDVLRDLFRRYEVEESPAVDRLAEMALSGVAYHHAGMLPVHKEIVERLFTSGLVKMLFATETFALGVNMPARAVAFDSLRKFDGERVDYMLCREYGQMAGRAGRQGIDTHGLVISRVDASFDRPNTVRRVVTGPPERVDSRFDPDYTTILALYEHMGDRVVETYEKSFAKFQRENRRGRSGGRSSEERVLAARLGLLKRNGYIEDGRLTPKGVFTAHVSGNEIAAAEWLFTGLLDAAEGWRLGALLLAASYEPRIEESGRPPRDRALREIAEHASALLEEWRETEWNAGLADLAKRPDFGLSAVVELWCGGAELSRCREVTSLSEGDIVRWLRQMLQYARQIQRALPADRTPLREKIAAFVRLANRDEVDARRQLELGQDPSDGEDADDGEPSDFAALGDDRLAAPAAPPPEAPPEPEPFGPDLDDEAPFGPDPDDEPEDEQPRVAPRKAAEPDDDFGAGIE